MKMGICLSLSFGVNLMVALFSIYSFHAIDSFAQDALSRRCDKTANQISR